MSRIALPLLTVLMVLAIACVADPVATPQADLGADLAVDLAMTMDQSTPADQAVASEDLVPPNNLTLPTFTPPSPNLSGGWVTGMAISTSDSDDLWAISPVDVYASIDAGITWSRLVAVPLAINEALTAVAASPTHLFVGTSQGRVYRVGHGQADWTSLESGDLGVPFALGGQILSLTTHDGFVFAAAASGLKRLSGGIWEDIRGELTSGFNQELYLDRELITRTLYLRRSDGVYRSSPDPVSWILVAATTPLSGSFFGQASTTFAATVNADSTVKVVTEAGLVQSTALLPGSIGAQAAGALPDGGVLARTADGYHHLPTTSGSWAPLSGDPTPEADRFLSTSTDLYGYGKKGVFRTSIANVSALVDRSTGITATSVATFAARADEPSRVWAGTGRGLYRWEASTWSQLPLPNQRYAAIAGVALAPNGRALVTTRTATSLTPLYRSASDGLDFTLLALDHAFVDIAYSSIHGTWFACRDDAFVRSTDGDVWTSPITDVDLAAPLATSCKHLALHPTADVLFVAASKDRVWRSDDGGASWTEIATNRLPSTPIDGLLAVPDALDAVYARLIGTGIMRLSPSAIATTYTAGEAVYGLAIDPVNPAILYVATLTSAEMSTNTGMTWTASPTTLTRDWPLSIFVHPGDRRQRWLGTTYRGVYQSIGTLVP